MPEREPPPGSADDLRRENERLRRENERLEGERERWHREREQLRRKIDRLQHQLDAARRAGFRQAAPFSKGPPLDAPRRPGRRPGAAYGPKAYRAIPTHVEEIHEATLPTICPHCQGPVDETSVATQYQEDLPVVRPVVRQFRVHIGHCRQCGRRLQARHPLQTSDALGAATAQLGPQAISLAVVLNKQLGVPLNKISTLFQQTWGLTVTPGGVVQALQRAARRAEPTYDALIDTVRHSLVVAPDETGWKVAAALQWLWAYATPDTTVYAIQPGRGFAEAAAMLGADYDGVLVRDGWAPYRQFTRAIPQTCLAHLLRRCHTLHEDHPHAAFAPQVQTILQQALDVRDRRDAQTISAHGVAVARGHLLTRLNRLIETPGPLADNRRFAAHLSVEFPGIFTFLLDPRIDATTWRAEHAIRPAVVTRKVCGGNRTWAGARTQQVLASVVRTAHQRHLDTADIFTALLRAPQPFVPASLQTPT